MDDELGGIKLPEPNTITWAMVEANPAVMGMVAALYGFDMGHQPGAEPGYGLNTMTDDELGEMRRRHHDAGYGECICEHVWPCDAVRLLDEIDRLRAEPRCPRSDHNAIHDSETCGLSRCTCCQCP